MEDYAQLYYTYRSKYYNACSRVNDCEAAIYDLKQSRKAVVNAINSLEKQIKKYNVNVTQLNAVLAYEEHINTKLTAVQTKTTEAAVNYTSMVNTSDVTVKDLNDVYSEETTRTKAAISSVFEGVRSKQSAAQQMISQLQTQLNQKNADLEDIDRQISTQKNNLSSWKNSKKNYYYNMEYYKKKAKEQGQLP